MVPKEPTGAERMRALALQLPHQLRDGFRAGLESVATIPADASSVALFGMGGSAIAGDLAATLTDPETELSLRVIRSPELPRSLHRGGHALIASYSGNTWETLHAYDEAGRRGIPRVVLTSGGALAERAAEDDVPCVVVPAGGPPRAWVGFVLGGVLGLLDPAFPESNEDRIGQAVEILEKRIAGYASRRGPPSRWAAQLKGREPAIYTETGFAGLARRWKTQLEENAKRGASFDVVPELFHNAVVGWDAISAAAAAQHAVVQLEWSEAPATTAARFGYLARLLGDRKVTAIRVPLSAPDRLVALVTGVSLGDFFSLAVAEQAHVDPYPVDAITRMKTSLERTADRAVPRATAPAPRAGARGSRP